MRVYGLELSRFAQMLTALGTVTIAIYMQELLNNLVVPDATQEYRARKLWILLVSSGGGFLIGGVLIYSFTMWRIYYSGIPSDLLYKLGRIQQWQMFFYTLFALLLSLATVLVYDVTTAWAVLSYCMSIVLVAQVVEINVCCLS